MRLIVTSSCRSACGLAFVSALIVALLGGCNRNEPEKPSASAATKPAARETDPEPVLSPGDAAVLKGAPGEANPSTPADLAWEQLAEALQPPPEPPEWQLQEPTKEQIAAFEKTNSVLAAT